MSVERLNNPKNMKYPTTVYGGTDLYAFSKKGTKIAGEGTKDQYNCEWLFDVTDLPETSEVDVQILKIEANSVIKSVDVFVVEELTGGTDFTIGLRQPDGTVIDDNGLVEANTTSAANSYIPGDGALVGASTGNNDAQLFVQTSRTAGVIKVQIEYIKAGT